MMVSINAINGTNSMAKLWLNNGLSVKYHAKNTPKMFLEMVQINVAQLFSNIVL